MNATHLAPGVDAGSSPQVKGLWVSDADRTIGLIEQAEYGGYLVIYNDTSGGGTLPLAVTADGVQLPKLNPDDPYRFISWDDLYDLVQANKKK